jgi:hypothetical protein
MNRLPIRLLQRLVRSLGIKPRICDDVGAWARRNGVLTQVLHDPVYEEVSEILSSDEVGRDELKKREFALRLPQELVVLRNARVRFECGMLILPDGCFCEQGQWTSEFVIEHPGFSFYRPSHRYNILGKAFSLLSKWSAEYFHWFNDVLPRLITAIPFLPESTKFLINVNPRQYQLDSLRLLGIPLERLIEHPPDAEAIIEELFFATPLGHVCGSSGQVLRQLRDDILSAMKIKPSETQPERIWVSRERARTRRLLNEFEIKPILNDYGFSFIVLEEMPWLDQVRIVTNAKIIAGVHGAGLMNIIFAKQCLSMGELWGAKVYPHYLTVASQLRAQFLRLQCDTRGNSMEKGLSVVPEVFAHWLEELIHSSHKPGL